jgi:hypothetical protein
METARSAAAWMRVTALVVRSSRSSRRASTVVPRRMALKGFLKSWLTMPMSCCSKSERFRCSSA